MEAMKPEFPLDLFNYLKGRAVVHASCSSSMGLVVYVLLFALVLAVDLLLV
jgi:hypothetical protein